jgi:hypothetical protein
MATSRPGPRDLRTYPISDPARLRAALDWATLQASAQMVGPDHPLDTVTGHDLKSAFVVLYGCVCDLVRGETVRLIPTPPPDEAARHEVPPVDRPGPRR